MDCVVEIKAYFDVFEFVEFVFGTYDVPVVCVDFWFDVFVFEGDDLFLF